MKDNWLWLKVLAGILLVAVFIGLFVFMCLGSPGVKDSAWKKYYDSNDGQKAPVEWCDSIPDGFVPTSRLIEISPGPWGDSIYFRLRDANGKYLMVCNSLYISYNCLPERVHYTGTTNYIGDNSTK